MRQITLKSCLYPDNIALDVQEVFGSMKFRWMNSGEYSPVFQISSGQVKNILEWFKTKESNFYKITIGESWIQFKKKPNTILYVSYGDHEHSTYGVTMEKPQTLELYEFFVRHLDGE